MFLPKKQPNTLASNYIPEYSVWLCYLLKLLYFILVYIATTMRNMFVMVVVIRDMVKGVKISGTSGSFKKSLMCQ
jgi:hypothetical protein